MSKFALTLLEKISDRVLDSALDKVDEALLEPKLKHFMKRAISDFIEDSRLEDPDKLPPCILDSDAIKALDVSLIRPHLSVDEMVKNLAGFFSNCIRVDDEEYYKYICRYLCTKYKDAVAGYISISDVNENLEKLRDKSSKEHAVISSELHRANNQLMSMDKNLDSMYAQLRGDGLYPLSFLESLDHCKVYCFICLRFLDNVDKDYLIEVGEDIFGAESVFYTDSTCSVAVDYNFPEPYLQWELKEMLDDMSAEFCASGIQVYSVMSHI